MKISVENIRFFNQLNKTAVDPMPKGIDALVEKINTQLGGVDEVVDLGKKYQGVLIVKVVECIKHPNADKLSLCKIDDGGIDKKVKRDSNGLIQVVCGAPNVKADMLAAWIPPGQIVPSTIDKDPFELEARELRGEVSNGMLASAAELDISNDHSGIVEIDQKAEPGQAFADVYKLNDYIIDIENKMFTHRPDLFGMMGIARELAGIQGQKFTSPEWYLKPKEIEESSELALEVENQIPELAPRFMAVAISGIKIGPSPLWLQINLMRVGIKPINNIVDITNYLMMVTAQPLHAYDYDKVKALGGAKLIVRKAKKDEKIKALGGKDIALRPDDIVIASSKEAIGIAGVIGGASTEVDANTKNIILECANFNMYAVRRTSMAHGLFTDASTRFTKGQSPLQCSAVITKTIDDILRLCGGSVASRLIDEHKKLDLPAKFEVKFINEILGTDLDHKEIEQLLNNVEINTVDERGMGLQVQPPFWRTDLEIYQDIAEEVGRLFGFNKLPKTLPQRTTSPPEVNDLIELKKTLRGTLAGLGANEVLTYNFVHGKLLENADQNPKDSYKLRNALSPELQYYRQTLTPSLLDKVHSNIKAGYDKFALFEIGKSHNKIHSSTDGLPDELEMLALVFADRKADKKSGSAYYSARRYLDELTAKFGLNLQYKPADEKMVYPVTAPFDLKRSALATDKNTGTFIGIVGEYKPSVNKNFKLPANVAGFEIGTTHILEAVSKKDQNSYVPLAKYPSTEQDLCLRVDTKITYEELFESVNELAQTNKPVDVNVDISLIDIYQDEKDKAHKQITIRLNLVSYERTLTSDIPNKLLGKIADGAHKSIKAERV